MATVLKNNSTLTTAGSLAAISRRSAQDAKGSSSTTSVTVSYPGATIAGDLLIATCYTNGAAPAITGWTGFSQGFDSNILHLSIFYKTATGTETSIQATSTGASIMQLHIYEYQNNLNPVTLDVAFTGTSGSTVVQSFSTPNITTIESADLIVGCVGLGGTSGASFSMSGLNQRQNDSYLIDGDLIATAVETNLSGTASWTTGRTYQASIIGAFCASIAPGITITQGQGASAGQNLLLIQDGLGASIFDVTDSSALVAGDKFSAGAAGITEYISLGASELWQTSGTGQAGLWLPDGQCSFNVMQLSPLFSKNVGMYLRAGTTAPTNSNAVIGIVNCGDLYWQRDGTPLAGSGSGVLWLCTLGGTSPSWKAVL